jgi:hypothetical protein
LIKRTLFTLLLVTFGAVAGQAQTYLGIKFGSLNPEDAKAGFLVGIATGKQVDERVDFGLAADLFIRRFSQETEVGEDPQSGGTDVRQEISFSMYALPLMAQLTLNVMPGAMVEPYASISGGYEIVLSSESNYVTGEKDSRFYGGFGWQIALGGRYPLGYSSALLAEIFYNGATVKRSKGKDDYGFPIHEELNFSGMGFRLGFRLNGI